MGKMPEVLTSLPHEMQCFSLHPTDTILSCFRMCLGVCLGPAQVEALLVLHLGLLSADMSVLLEHGQVARRWAKCLRFPLLYHMRCICQVLFLPPSSRHNLSCFRMCLGVCGPCPGRSTFDAASVVIVC